MPEPLRVHLAPGAPAALGDPRALGLDPLAPWPPGERRVLIPRVGWVLVRVYARAAPVELWRARFQKPRSLSLAEREWNLVCRLRGRGVGTPEPLSIGARGGAFFARESFIVLDEPRGFVALDAWARGRPQGEARRLGLAALARCAAQLFASGIALPRLRAEDVLLSAPQALGAAPSRERGLDESSECSAAPPRGPGLRALPAVVVTRFAAGRERAAPPAAVERRRFLERLERELSALELSPRERLAFAARALRGARRARRARRDPSTRA